MAPLVWLITGCSSGFGEQFVDSILARGDHVIATARQLPSIAHLSDKGARICQLDLTWSQAGINAVISKAIAFYNRIDVLVNNAGYVQVGLWEDLEYADWLRQFETNVFGTIKVTKALLPHMRQRKEGSLVFISSLNGFVGHPMVGAYSASKHALEGAVEALAHEIKPFGLKTLIIEPGRFRTSLLSTRNLQVRKASSAIPEYAQFHSETIPAIEAESGNQPGDTSKLVSIVLDLVRGEGIAKDKNVPLRILLGEDAWTEVGGKLRGTLKDMEEWEEVTRSTDLD